MKEERSHDIVVNHLWHQELGVVKPKSKKTRIAANSNEYRAQHSFIAKERIPLQASFPEIACWERVELQNQHGREAAATLRSNVITDHDLMCERRFA